MNKGIQVLSPVGESNSPTGKLAERPKSLESLRIGLLDNGKEFSDLVFNGLAEILQERFKTSILRFWRKGYPAKLAPFLPEMAGETDVAISGVGH
ncbi:MAG TPA: hypothetical protein VGR97_14440 [Candidatus Acidoferrales bacterium]|nr:hypothetical protein [Candidatus Acidoferrales bacterium]